ncbi:MAG: RNA polymerase sigma factor [Bacteroidales bacterium]|nr:RNA polymerase sigma factor [Bacteroidales bacterium]
MDSSQFKQILLPLGEKMYRTAFRIVNNSDIAKDIVQEVYIALWDKRESLPHIDYLESFVMKAVKNKSIDILRTSRIYKFDDNFIDNDSTIIENKYDDNEQLNAIIRKMNLLPAQQKHILTMRSLQDLSITEIEQITGLSNINIRTLLSRARKKLRELCQQELNER